MAFGGRSIFIVFLILAIAPMIFAEVDTSLNVPNSPPEFQGIIPNFSWSSGPFLDAFNMNDYFEDFQGDSMNFSYSGEDQVIINFSSNGSVSFFPPQGYIGVEVITFYAEDEIGSVPSNEVYLGIGVDMEAPKWSNPQKTRDKIFQNDQINFNMTWTDNFGLKSYYTSIDQGEGWVDYAGDISGVFNVSSSKIQISAPVGKIVKWKVCATDLSDNFACSDVFEFTVFATPVDNGVPTESTGTDTGGDSTSVTGRITGENIKDLYEDAKDIASGNAEEFSIDVDSFLVTLKQGTSLTRVLEISNTGNNDLSFDLIIDNLDEFAELSESNFTIKAGESKTIIIDFNVDLTTDIGQYFGSLIVKSVQTVIVPLVLTINSVDLDFFVNVSVLEETKNVKPGKSISALIEINNFGDNINSEIKVDYAIKDFYGNIYDSAEEVAILNEKIVLEKSLNVPEDILLGKYIFYARASNEKDVALNSDVFTVGLSFRFEAFLKTSFVFLAILILSIISIVLTMRHRRHLERQKALSLYVKLNELKELMKAGNYERAATLYVAIKRIYGEPINGDVLENRERLVEEIKKLSSKIDFEDVVEKPSKEKKKGENIESDSGSEQSDVVVEKEGVKAKESEKEKGIESEDAGEKTKIVKEKKVKEKEDKAGDDEKVNGEEKNEKA